MQTVGPVQAAPTFFSWHTRVFQRSRGESSVAAAAYRAGDVLTDQRVGVLHAYEGRWRSGHVAERGIAHRPCAAWAADREQLWNAAELAERRCNSCVAREHRATIPNGLTLKRMVEMIKGLAEYLVLTFGVVVDWVLHRPRGANGNWHFHALTSTRVAEAGGFGAKTRSLDDRLSGGRLIDGLRAFWATSCNVALEEIGSSIRVDHRSYAAQGIERIPQLHLGKAAAALERRGKPTRIGDYNREIRAINLLRDALRRARAHAARDQAAHEQLLRESTTTRARRPARDLAREPDAVSLAHFQVAIDALHGFVAEARRRGSRQGGLDDAMLRGMVAEMAVAPRRSGSAVSPAHGQQAERLDARMLSHTLGDGAAGSIVSNADRQPQKENSTAGQSAGPWQPNVNVNFLLRQRRRKAAREVKMKAELILAEGPAGAEAVAAALHSAGVRADSNGFIHLYTSPRPSPRDPSIGPGSMVSLFEELGVHVHSRLGRQKGSKTARLQIKMVDFVAVLTHLPGTDLDLFRKRLNKVVLQSRANRLAHDAIIAAELLRGRGR